MTTRISGVSTLASDTLHTLRPSDRHDAPASTKWSSLSFNTGIGHDQVFDSLDTFLNFQSIFLLFFHAPNLPVPTTLAITTIHPVIFVSITVHCRLCAWDRKPKVQF
jgi:hypothetical protein